MAIILWHIELSHYNEKARWALDYKEIPYTLRTPLPGLHGFAALAITRGKQRRLPVLDLDGRRIGDSTAIIAALEDYRPDPPLYPSDREERIRALNLEDYFDEELGPRLRRYVWQYTLDDTSATVESLMASASPVRKRVMAKIVPLMRPVVRKDFDVNEAAAAEALAGIRAAMDRLESELQPSGYLVGDSFTVADLTACAMFTPLLAPPQRPYAPAKVAPQVMELREELAARPGGKWIEEMYARHRGIPAAVVA